MNESPTLIQLGEHQLSGAPGFTSFGQKGRNLNLCPSNATTVNKYLIRGMFSFTLKRCNWRVVTQRSRKKEGDGLGIQYIVLIYTFDTFVGGASQPCLIRHYSQCMFNALRVMNKNST